MSNTTRDGKGAFARLVSTARAVDPRHLDELHRAADRRRAALLPGAALATLTTLAVAVLALAVVAPSWMGAPNTTPAFVGVPALTTPPPLPTIPTGPEGAPLRGDIQCRDEEHQPPPSTYRVYGTRPWPGHGVIVVYGYTCPPESWGRGEHIGFGFTGRMDAVWATTGGGGNVPLANSTGMKVAAYTGHQPGYYGLVYGLVLSEDIQAVEAVFDNGRTVRDETTGGVFAAYDERAGMPCLVRALGAGDQVIETADLSAQSAPDRCAP